MGSIDRKQVIAVCIILAVAMMLFGWTLIRFFGWDALAALTAVQATVTVSAVLVGGVFAYYKLDLFREFHPHLTIEQSISHRRVGTTSTHMSVTARVHNSSKIAVSIREALYRIQVVSPTTDEEVEGVYQEYSRNNVDENYMPWPIDSESLYRWDDHTFVIEPGGTDQEVFEFLVPPDLESVLVYAYFSREQGASDPRNAVLDPTLDDKTEDAATTLWEVATVYDLR